MGPAPLDLVLEAAAQSVAGAVEAGADGADGDLEALGDLLVFEGLQVTEFDDAARKGNEEWDVVTVVLSWREDDGKSAPNAAGDNQQMRLSVPVWR